MTAQPRVVDNPPQERFELWLEEELVGILGYRNEAEVGVATGRPDAVVGFMYTVVEEEHRGRGLAATLVRAGFDAARERGWTVRPVCTYVQHFLSLHREYRDLVVDE